MERALVTLIAADGEHSRRSRALCAYAPFLEQPESFDGVYTALDASCLSLARAVADRLWLTPRFLSSATRSDALAELLATLALQRPDRTVLVVPERWLADVLAQLAPTRPLRACSSLGSWLYELTLDAMRGHRVHALGA